MKWSSFKPLTPPSSRFRIMEHVTKTLLRCDLSPMTAPTTGPPIGTTVGVEQCNDLIESTAQALRRNREPDPDRKSAFGIPNCLLRSHEVARR
jgi:hypothetical protein